MGTNRIINLTGRGELRLFSTDASQFITVRYPAANAASPIYDLPGTQGAAATFLKNDGTGILSWASGTSTLQSAYTAGASITVVGGTPVILDLAAGGEVLRITEGVTTVRLGATAAGNGDIGTSSAHGFEVRTNAIARISITSAGVVSIPGATSTGALTVTGDITAITGGVVLDNARSYKQKNSGAAIVPVLTLTATDMLEIGGSALATSVNVRSTGGFAVGLGSTAPVGIVEVGHATASTLILRSTTTPETTAHKSSIFFATATGAIVATNETAEIRVSPTVADPSVLWSKMDVFLNTGDSLRNVLSIDPWNTGLVPAVNFGFDNGTQISIKQTVPVLVNTTAGASVTVANFIPFNCMVLGISFRILTTITGPTSVDIGVSGSLLRYVGALTVFSAGTSFNSFVNSTATETGPRIYRNSTLDLILTANGGNFTGGQLRMVCHYIDLTPPTS